MLTIPNIPDQISRAICAELFRSLPAPADDTPETLTLRNERALFSLAHLLPENAAEADIAVQVVAAQAHARDAFRGAAAAFNDPETAGRCRYQAAAMIRTAATALRSLERMQKDRQKAEAAMQPAAMERAGWRQRGEDAWHKETVVPGEPVLEPVALPQKEYGAMTPAERYVTLYPDRAWPILVNRGMPAVGRFAPPTQAIIDDLLTSKSPIVLEFVQRMQAVAAAAE
jgi:hypothetical protein